jgi:glycosyltransferase involved in cell wall biosynthesis
LHLNFGLFTHPEVKTMYKSLPLISIIVAFYNEADFLCEAVESIINQDYQNWELILVDDGSSDVSTAIAKEYAAKKERRIFYVDHPNHCNKGLSPSRNLGISMASGSYIAFLDADDVWDKQKLSSQIRLLQQNPQATVLLEAATYWYSWNKRGEDKIKYIGVPGNQLYSPPQLAHLLYPLSKGLSPCPSSIMLKKSVFADIGGFEESFTGIYSLFEDQAFLFKVYLSQPVYVSPQPNIWYRQRKGSITYKAKIRNERNLVLEYYLRWAKNYLRLQNKGKYDFGDLSLKVNKLYYRVVLLNRWVSTKTLLKNFGLKRVPSNPQKGTY